LNHSTSIGTMTSLPRAAGVAMAAQIGEQLVVKNLAPRIGSEIVAPKDRLLSGAFSAQIRELLEQRGVIAFRELYLTDAEQVAFTKTLGTIVDEGINNIYKITMDPMENAQAEYLKGAFFWHIDGTMLPVPIFASIMSSRRLSPVGGDTEFSNTYAAYDELSEHEKRTLADARVVHSFEVSQRYVNPEPSYADLQAWQEKGTNTLPLIWRHRSGRRSLVLGSTAAYVVGMNPEQSTALLCKLRDFATQAPFTYRHQWKVGDLVIWDNTGTMHRATPYPLDSGRLMHRTKIQGEEPFRA
jgi:alpha-ketoglutarate-dependent taurine dioxygenase